MSDPMTTVEAMANWSKACVRHQVRVIEAHPEALDGTRYSAHWKCLPGGGQRLRHRHRPCSEAFHADGACSSWTCCRGRARLGSAVLTAANPERYTVMDTRAIVSVRALGLPGASFDNADHREWLDYLTTCRSLRDTTGESLRAVDRALFKAQGAMNLPS